MAIQLGDFVQLSDEHMRYDMTDGVGTRDGSLRTSHDYGRVSSMDARLKLVEVTSVTRLDADGAAIKWSYGARQLKRADQSVGEEHSCAFDVFYLRHWISWHAIDCRHQPDPRAAGRRCAWFDKIKMPGSAPALYDVTEYELIGLREDDHLLNMVLVVPRFCFATTLKGVFCRYF